MTALQAAPRIAVPPVIDAGAFTRFDPAARIAALGGDSMGTTWQVHAAMPPGFGMTDSDLAVQIAARLARICAQMSHWDKHSCLFRFNHAPAGAQVRLPDDFAQVMGCAFTIAAASAGAFDPALGRLTDAWGLGPNPAADPPTTDAFERALAASGWGLLVYDPAAQILTQPGGSWLDLSGIAKGFAVDAVTDLLSDHGIHHALVEIGGECCGRGLRPDGDPWWVELENPPCAGLPALRVAIHQMSAATSGDYLRGAHTLDPVTGLPIHHAVTAVTVLHQSCMVADAWATALNVLEPPRAQALARSHGLAARMVFRSGDEWFSPAFQQMF